MGDSKNLLKTDMNDRERERFAKTLREMADMATKGAAALEARNDTEFVMNLVILSLIGGNGPCVRRG